jgi:hypothetical protein
LAIKIDVDKISSIFCDGLASESSNNIILTYAWWVFTKNFERHYTDPERPSDRGWYMVAFVNTVQVLHLVVVD